LSFVDKVILRYHLKDLGLISDLNSSDSSLYNLLLEYLSSQIIVSQIQLKFDTETDVKKPIEFY